MDGYEKALKQGCYTDGKRDSKLLEGLHYAIIKGYIEPAGFDNYKNAWLKMLRRKTMSESIPLMKWVQYKHETTGDTSNVFFGENFVMKCNDCAIDVRPDSEIFHKEFKTKTKYNYPNTWIEETIIKANDKVTLFGLVMTDS